METIPPRKIIRILLLIGANVEKIAQTKHRFQKLMCKPNASSTINMHYDLFVLSFAEV